MPASVMLQTKPATGRTPRESTPQEIITSARNAPAGAAGPLVVCGTSALLMWGAFTPVDFGPLAWLCLVPLLTLVRLARPATKMYLAAYLGGLAFWALSLQWMRLGHPAMYLAWWALSLYLALYFPLFVALCRVAVWRLRVPLTLAGPIVWVGLEILRGHLMTGFSWYYLAHSQHRWIELIQISDVVGAYGVSFLIALFAACTAEMLPVSMLARMQLLPASAAAAGVGVPSALGRGVRVVCCLAVFALALGYGYSRRSGNEFGAGPRVALIQGNEPSDVKHDPLQGRKIQRRHEVLTGVAVQHQPDLIVWPETMFRWPLFETPPGVSDDELQQAHPGLPVAELRDLKVRTKLATLAQGSGAAMVIGLETLEADRDNVRTYNSAALIRPDGVIAGRYDKLHRVVFGEYIPLVETFPWLRSLTPFGANFGISAGKACIAFEHKGFRFAPIICFEDTDPQLVRGIVQATTEETPTGPKKVDFLVNLTNDGWFHGSSELDQHLITAAFRCVECRTPMLRAVNTGISAIIDGDGVVRQKARGFKTDGPKEDEAVVSGVVPLDSRRSPYLAGGDWFAGACLVCCGFLAITGLASRWLPGKSPAVAGVQPSGCAA